MQRRGSVNINDLINRFEVQDDYENHGNVKYVKISRPTTGHYYPTYSDDELFDENRIRRSYPRMSGTNMQNAKQVTKQTIATILQRVSSFLEMASTLPFPRMSVISFGLTSLFAIFLCPRALTERALYPGFRLIFSIVYPGYRSFKAVRNKDIREYLKWIVYWIVYAVFTCVELFTDALLNWFPFYYEIKVIFLIWLLGPSSRGAMKIYKSIIHPTLISKEQDIDDIIQVAQDRGYMHVFRLGSKSVNYANRIMMQNENYPTTNSSYQLMRNLSLSSISDVETIPSEEIDEILRYRKFSTSSLPENEINYRRIYSRPEETDLRLEDISSGYSSSGSPSSVRKKSSKSGVEKNEERKDVDKEKSLRNLSQESSNDVLELNKAKDDDEVVGEVNCDVESSKNRITTSAYNQLGMKRNDVELPSCDLQTEFLAWLQHKTQIEKLENSTQEVECRSTTTKEDENEKHSDFDEFKDVVDDEEQDNNDGNEGALNVPLVIHEVADDGYDDKSEAENGQKKQTPTNDDGEKRALADTRSTLTSSENVIEARITLTSSSPLEIVTTSLSSSTSSLSSTSGGKVIKHNKGRAPPPPGHFYDKDTKKLYKETEL